MLQAKYPNKWTNIGSPRYRASLLLTQYPNLICAVCGKKYYMWHWASLHVEGKHPLEFAAELPDGMEYKEELIRKNLKLKLVKNNP